MPAFLRLLLLVDFAVLKGQLPLAVLQSFLSRAFAFVLFALSRKTFSQGLSSLSFALLLHFLQQLLKVLAPPVLKAVVVLLRGVVLLTHAPLLLGANRRLFLYVSQVPVVPHVWGPWVLPPLNAAAVHVKVELQGPMTKTNEE